MFDRFSYKARMAVLKALREAHAAHSDWLETEHLLLGLLDDQEIVGRFFRGAETARTVREAIAPGRPRAADSPSSGDLPITREVKRVFKTCLKQAGNMGHLYPGAEHLLLAITLEEKSRTSRILREHGISDAAVREGIAGLISEGKRYDSL